MEKGLSMQFKAILAMDVNGGIGRDNALPWHSKEDLKWFKDNTMGDIIVMGYNTWKSIGSKSLAGRVNVVVTSKIEIDGDADVIISGDVQYILEKLSSIAERAGIQNVWFIGGTKLFEQFLPVCEEVYVTYMHQEYECDIRLDENLLIPFNVPIYIKRLDNMTFSILGKSP